MINLVVKSGLGNQLFQYAYARALQEEYKRKGSDEDLKINPFYVNNTFVKGDDQRKMSLDNLLLNSEVQVSDIACQEKELKNFKVAVIKSNGLLNLLKWKLFKKKPIGKEKFLERVRKGVYYTYNPYTNYGFPLSEIKEKYVFGYFQDVCNFSEISEIIKQEVRVKTAPSKENKDFINEISSVNAVCVHVRRGDYFNSNWKCLQVCDFDYYNNGINYILDNVENPVFFVFSNTHDDIEWVRNNYRFYDKKGEREIVLKYVDLNNPDYEEFRLMYSCKHFIISNSTFSWWGAYVAEKEDTVVIVPKRWNLAYDNDTTIYLSNWIKL